MKKNYFKKSLSLVLTVLMIMSCWVFVPAQAAIPETPTLDAAISAYESKMNGTVYTNMKTAYAAYIDALEARDAYKYGGKTAAAAGIDAAATALTNATNAMGTWTYTGYTETTPKFDGDTGTAYVEGSTHDNILYTESEDANQKYTYTVANLASALMNAKTVVVIDGVNTPKIPIYYIGRADYNKSRYIYKLYPSSGTGVGTTYSTTESSYFSMAEAWRGQGTTADFAWIWANGTSRGGYGPNNQQQSGKINSKNWRGAGDFSLYAGVMQIKASGFSGIDTKIFVPHSSTGYASDATAITGDESLQFYLLAGDSASDNSSLTISHGIAVINYTYLQTQVKNYASSVLSNIKNYTQDSTDVKTMLDKIELAQKFNVSHSSNGKTAADVSTEANVTAGYNYSSTNAAVAACDTDMNTLANAVNTAKNACSTDASGYSGLRTEITTSEKIYILGNTKYTTASWSAFETAYKNAQTFMGDVLANSYAKNSDAVTYTTALANARAGLTCVIDVGYNNIFSLASWANSNAPNVSRGSATYDLSAGTITTTSWDEATGTAWVNAATGRTAAQAQDCYTSYGFGSSYSMMPATGSTSYTLKFNATAAGQCYVFFYTASGAASTAHQSLGAASGANTKTFTTPSDCTGIQVRFGSTGAYSKTITFSNIVVCKTEHTDTIGATGYVERVVLDPGASVDLPELVRNGYIFDGWFTDEACTAAASDPYTATTSTTLYAKWTQRIYYTVTFKNYDGTVLATQTVEKGYNATTPAVTPTKDPDDNYEYKFLGWDKSYESVSENLTVTAQFQSVDHSGIEYIEDSGATCTENGWIIKYCTACDYEWNGGLAFEDTAGEYSPALGHHYVGGEVVKNSSTGVDGVHEVKCIRANEGCTATTTETHNYGQSTGQSTATCITAGETYYKCACNQEKTVVGTIDSNNHVNTELRDVVAAECEKEGYSGDTWCKDCGVKTETGSVTAALEHKYTTYNYNGNATCFANGTETATCDLCKTKTDTREAANTKLTHVYNDEDYVYNNNAQCEVNGTETAACAHGCGTEDTREAANTARTHIFEGAIKNNGDGTHSYECTYDDCTAYGGTVNCSNWVEDGDYCKCDDCGYTKAHTWGKWQAHADNTGLAAGKMTRECTVCGADDESGCNYEVTAHSDETCTSPERTTYTCKDCGHGYTATGKAATGHDYTGTVKSYSNGYHSFLCQNGCNTYGYNGTQGLRANCTYKYENTAKDTHNAICTVCNYTKSETCSGGTATCEKLAVCENCNEEWGTLAAHTFNGDVVELTGDEHAYRCSVCKDSSIYGVGTTVGDTESCYGGTATCKELAKCEKCNNEWGTLAAHTFNGDVVAFEGDEHAYRCSVCKDGSIYGVGSEVSKKEACYGGTATCTTLAKCEKCNEDWGKLVDHNLTGTEKYLKLATESTCIANETYYKYCIGCENVFSDTETYEKPDTMKPHDYTCKDEYLYIATQAKCGVNETYYAYCSNEDCKKSSEDANNTFEKAGTALEHSWVNPVNNDNGTHTLSCENTNTDGWACKETLTLNCVDSALTFGYTAPTCISKGYTTYQCATCNYTWDGSYEDALGHNYTQKILDEAHHKDDPNCERGDVYWYDCSRCDKNAKDETDDKYTNLTFIDGVAREHSWVDKVDAKYLAAAATCTVAAKYYKSCEYSDCGISSKDITGKMFFDGDPLGHDWVHPAAEDLDGYRVIEADCVTDATYYFVCSRENCGISSEGVKEDGETWTDEGSALEHILAHTEAKDPTCTEAGNYEYWYCSRCDKYFKDADASQAYKNQEATVIGSLGHAYVTVEFKKQTCEEDGHNEHRYCSRCKAEHPQYKKEVYSKTGHDFTGAWAYDKELDYHSKYCLNDCGASGIVVDGEQIKFTVDENNVVTGGIACTFSEKYSNKEVDGKHSHAKLCECGNGDWTACADAEPNVVEVTCLADGYTEHTCDVCGYKWITDVVKSEGHKWIDKPISNGDNTHSTKCSVCGETKKASTVKCSGGTATCNAKAICDKCETEYGTTTSHTFGENPWTSNNDATCTEDGTKWNTCTICDEKVTEKDAGSKLGHDMTDYGYDMSGWTKKPADFDEEIKAPNCSADGKAISYCTRCDYYKTRVRYKDSTAHDWEKDANGEELWVSTGNCSTGIILTNKCTLCAKIRTEKSETNAHSWEITFEALPTCEGEGYRQYTCSVCDAQEDHYYDKAKHEELDDEYEDADLAPLDHDVKYTEDDHVDGNCSKYGYYSAPCSRCDKIIVKPDTEYGEHDFSVIVPATKPTCEKDGYSEHMKCSICGIGDGTQIVEPATGHEVNEDGKCDECGEVIYDDGARSCGCICHKSSGFMKLIYKIINFFWKLFRISKSCDCGNIHW